MPHAVPLSTGTRGGVRKSGDTALHMCDGGLYSPGSASLMNTFLLHPRLAADTVVLGRLELSLLLLMNDATYPWFILVPERAGASEIYQLAETDRLALIEEVALLSRALTDDIAAGQAECRGARQYRAATSCACHRAFHSDPAWPAPVWGKVETPLFRGRAAQYSEAHRAAARDSTADRRLAANTLEPAAGLRNAYDAASMKESQVSPVGHVNDRRCCGQRASE